MTYGYDSDGRIINRGGTFDITNLPAALASATYDANNRLTKWGRQAVSYDADGNLVSNGKNTYAWNTRNQLTGIGGGTSASFLYDALGRRESKTISSTSINFLYDGLNLEQELSGTTPTVNYLTGAGIDETLSRTDSSGTQSYLTDNLGSSLALTNSSGAISTSYSYEPYGNTTTSGASSTNEIQYTGRENDGTGLYYYRARYYSPTYGRFISEDPMGLGGGINTYAYTYADPIGGSDPSGETVYLMGQIAGGPGSSAFGNITTPPSYHLYLLLIPNNPGDFAGQPGWQNFSNAGMWYSISGHPEHGFWGDLSYTPNYPGNGPGQDESILGIVSAPACETDTQFIKNLLAAAASYKNQPYSYPDLNPFDSEPSGYMGPGKYNSNSFVAGVIQAAGATPPTIGYPGMQVPGYSNPVPIH